MRQLLEPIGLSLMEASGGQEGIELFQKKSPHLIWMDIRMPDMDGYEAAKRIREAEAARRNEDGTEIHTPIIAFTAGAMENKESSPLAGVFDDWVYKPFREEEIFAKLEKHLGVQFVYQPAGFPAVQQEASKDRAALIPADLSDLPADWIGEFSRMLKMGHSKQLLALIDRVHLGHAKVAAFLGDMVRTHNFERLIPLFEEANKGNANGQSPEHHG